MKTVQEILQEYAVNYLEFQKGKALCMRQQVLIEKADQKLFSVEVAASVRDLSNRYDTVTRIYSNSLSAENKWDSFTVEESSCSCNEYHIPQKLCRHRVAALLQYFSCGETEVSVRTTSVCADMIQTYRQRLGADLAVLEEGSIRLMPRFLIEGRRAVMEFYVGNRHMYPVRDLISFKRSFQKGERIAFGKLLEYVNCEQVYDQESLSLLQVLCLQLDSYLHHWTQSGRDYAVYGQKLQSVELEEAFADLYMKALTGKGVSVVLPDGSPVSMQVTRSDPQIELIIEKKGRDGAHLWIPDKCWLATGNRHIYLFRENYIYICSEEYSHATRIFFHGILQKAYPGMGHMEINYRDLPAFLSYVAEPLDGYLDICYKGLSASDFAPPKLTLTFRLSMIGAPDRLQLRVEAGYRDVQVELGGEEPAGSLVRDRKRESEVLQFIQLYFAQSFDANTYMTDSREASFEFLEKHIDGLRQYGKVELSEEIRKLEFGEAPVIKAGLTFMNNCLELNFESDVVDKSEVADILACYHRREAYHVSKSGKIYHLDRELTDALGTLTEALELKKDAFRQDKLILPGYRFLYAREILKDVKGLELQQSRQIQAIADHMERKSIEAYPVPRTLEAVLRDYQKYGYRWLKTLREYHFNGILADDMGLGQTIQVITLLLADQGKGTSLVVCPSSLVYNWKHEFQTFAPVLSVLVIGKGAKERREEIEDYQKYDVVITSYDLLRRDCGLYSRCHFYYQILDEAQFIKNHKTMNAKAAKEIQADYKLALTGTPIENRLSELWSIFDFLMPGYLYSYNKFRQQFELPLTHKDDRQVKDRLRKMTAAFMLRRSKEDVLKDLPEKLERIVYSDMEGEQRRLYEAAYLQFVEQLKGTDSIYYDRHKIQILSQLTRLRQLCCHPALCFENYTGPSAKLEACMELVNRAVNGNHKLLLFSQFTSMLDIIKKELDAQKTEYLCLTGSTSKEERIRLVEQFQTGSVPVFLISLKAGGTGLNLTAADIVIHYDPWWNVAAQNQATDRVHRIGQEKKVTVYKLIASDTLEEGIVKLQQSKKALSDDILSMDFGAIAAMSKEELLSLLSGTV